jgi:transcriptional regulator with XRE-family HTH domain
METSESISQICSRLRSLRENLRMNQSEFARFLELSQAAISKYEQGRIPSVEVLIAISKKCNCSVDWILFGTSPDSSNTPSIKKNGDSDIYSSIKFVTRNQKIQEITSKIYNLPKKQQDNVLEIINALNEGQTNGNGKI